MSTLIKDGERSLWPNIQRGACLVALLALSACASRMDGAPVVDRTSQAPSLATGAPTDQPPGPPPPGYYRVQPGDTLYRVALQNSQNYRDIASWNNLTNPNQIEVGQLLRVVPPGADVGSSTPMVSSTPLGSSSVQTAPLTPGAAQPSPYPSPYASGNGATPPSGYPSPYASTPATGNGPNGTNATNGPLSPSGNAAYAIPSPYTPGAATGASSTATNAPPGATPSPDAGAAVPSGPVTFIWPVHGKLIHKFSDLTKGLDIAGTAGTPVAAAAGGRVLYAGSGLRGYGNLIIIKHDNTFLTAYAHNRVLLVKENDVVQKGQTIAEMGNTDSDRVMLHFEVRQKGKPVDPLNFLPPQ